jgi:hypothetical protein
VQSRGAQNPGHRDRAWAIGGALEQSTGSAGAHVQRLPLHKLPPPSDLGWSLNAETCVTLRTQIPAELIFLI